MPASAGNYAVHGTSGPGPTHRSRPGTSSPPGFPSCGEVMDDCDMKVVVTGSSGLIGSALITNLRADGHDVVRLVRRAPGSSDEQQWDPASGAVPAGALDEADAVVHLAGVGIGDRRWNDDHKRAVLQSRVEGTTTIARAIADSPTPPRVLLSASAVGWYGETGDDAVDEQA